MTIRRRLTFSYIGILILLGLNLGIYLWGDMKRAATFEELRHAISRQTLLDSIQQKLSEDQKQVTLLSQFMADSNGSAESKEQIAVFDSTLDDIMKQVTQMSYLADPANHARSEDFAQSVRNLCASWRIFYENLGRNQSRAITEIALHSEPLSIKVMQDLLPQLQKGEKDSVTAASDHFYQTSSLVGRTSVFILIFSVVLSSLLAAVVARRISRTLGVLKAGADALGTGNLDHRIPVIGKDELSDLASAFNGMAAHLYSARCELEDRQRQMEVLMENAEGANRAKSKFLAHMSHELRTPMNAIIGYSELLSEEAEDAGNRAMIPDLNRIRGAGKHLLSLINDILDLSKIEAGKMDLDLEEFEIRGLVNEVISMMQPLAAKNFNRLETSIAPDVASMYADTMKVRQILTNLMSNACKFTTSGVIAVEVARELTEGPEMIVFRVRDSGIGMTPPQLAKVFDAFTQADGSTTRKYGGTGLGLTITRSFCHMMGGEVTLESELGVGTTFIARLPKRVIDQRTARKAG
jgi:signal transduction histidine kinase